MRSNSAIRYSGSDDDHSPCPKPRSPRSRNFAPHGSTSPRPLDSICACPGRTIRTAPSPRAKALNLEDIVDLHADLAIFRHGLIDLIAEPPEKTDDAQNQDNEQN